MISAVVGPSGSGKSSLLRILALVDRPTAGRVRIHGQDVEAAPERRLHELRRRHIGVVLQRPTHNLFPQLSVAEQLEQAARRRGAPLDQIDDALLAVGLGPLRRNRPAQLSGGEQQRLAVAVATIGAPALLLADEPTAELDADHAAVVIELLRRAADHGCGVVVNTHDPTVAAAADRVLELHHGTLHSERDGEAPSLAVIDEIGRLQLPSELLELFPDRRARLEQTADGVLLRPTTAVEIERLGGTIGPAVERGTR